MVSILSQRTGRSVTLFPVYAASPVFLPRVKCPTVRRYYDDANTIDIERGGFCGMPAFIEGLASFGVEVSLALQQSETVFRLSSPKDIVFYEGFFVASAAGPWSNLDVVIQHSVAALGVRVAQDHVPCPALPVRGEIPV